MKVKNIIVVESPAKVKTIERFLGPDYQVVATYGHVRDLPKSKLGVDVDHNFVPQYVVPTKAKRTITNLKAAFKTATTVYLATDFDREGEAIAWHVLEACKLSPKTTQRITFHEITEAALKDALKHPRKINDNLVNAQQARRVLDRLVGYTLSPFLWKKVTKGLSAGRVQSVTVRLIVDREREILAFKPQEYWSLEAEFLADKGVFKANLVNFQGKPISKLTIKNKDEADTLTNDLKKDTFVVDSIETKTENKFPYPPYTTSTLQQDANKRLRFTSKQTMRLAQDLYESGLITYMRTDSTTIAGVAQAAASQFIKSEYGQAYLPTSQKQYKTKSKGAQEAHEAIRPTKPDKTPSSLETAWSPRHKELYTLIWQRFMASQMKEANVQKIRCLVKGDATKSLFSSSAQKVTFDGFLKVYPIVVEEKTLPDLVVKEVVRLKELLPSQHFTEPPGRYSEASLVKTLEELGVGRPSTYAPTISTIIDRGYVRLEQRVFYPQEIGMIVTDLLKEHFPTIVDPGFTAGMEEDLDEIAQGKNIWTDVLAKFWQPFSSEVSKKTEEVTKQSIIKETGDMCPECGKPLVERFGKFGKFIGCSGFPECKYLKNIVNDSGVVCPECKEGSLIERRTRKGNRLFWGCNRYPKCKYATWNDPKKPAPVAKAAK